MPALAQEMPVSDPTFESQRIEASRVAASGDRFITVWGRGGNTGIYANGFRIRATRITRDGAILDPKSPSPRALDELPVEIRHGAEIWVTFRNYRAGVHDKLPV